MGGRFFLKTLGPPELIGADGRPLRFKVRKHLALLIYLAVDHRTMHTREALVELLWGGVDLSRGRHSLSVALSVLRSVLGAEGLKATNSQVRLARAAIALDLDLLERGAILGGDGAPDLEVDRFLPDWEIGDAPGFQHWRDRKSTEYLPVLQAAFLTLADQARRSGDVRRMLSCAARLLALDPLSEEGIRTRMQGLAMQGDRISALRSYEEWREELEHQLGAAPSESLAGLAARLRRPTMAPAFERECFTPRPDPWADRRFVGRAAEYRELVNAWESTLQFDTRHILLTGESGIGKSTLAMRFGSSVALEGAAVARIQCFELEQRIPFGMIGALIATLLESPGAVATAPESLAEIGRVVPRVAERFPSLPPPRRAEGETARIHFAEGTFALFDSIMDEQPLLLIVDDYPHSDEASLSVLHMLLRRAGTDRLMVVLTARPPESGESTQIRRIREGLSYLPLRQIALSPLTEAESDSMLGALLEKSGKEAAAPIRRAIVDAGRGNPMALDLLSQDWVVHGEAALAISLPAMSHDMPASALEAVGYDRLIERMLPDLAPRTRTALQLAAILGPRLNDLDCFDIASLTPAQTLAAMTELVDRRVLRDVGGRLEFTNELIRARLYLKIPSVARIRMHDGVANRLLAAGVVGESVPGLEIAWHCIRAKRRDQATPFLMSGARDAIVHGAPHEAVRALSSALGHLKGRAKDEAVVLLAESYQEMGEWKGALACLQEFSGVQRSDDHLFQMAHVLEVESRMELGLLPAEDLTPIARDLTARARDERESPLVRVQSALTAARIAGSIGATSLVESLSQGLGTIQTVGMDLQTRTKLLLANGMAHYHLRQNTEGKRKTHAGAQLLRETGAADSTFVKTQVGLAVFELIHGAYAESRPHLELAFHAAVKLDNFDLAALAAGNIALCCYRLGMAEEQVKWARITDDYSKLLHPGCMYRVNAAGRCSIGNLILGRTREGLAALNRLKIAKERAESYWVYQAAAYFEADIYWMLGDRSRALRTVTEAWGPNPRAPLSGFEGRYVRWKTLTLLESNLIIEAREMLDGFHRRIGAFDLLDQAEILCSMELVRRSYGGPWSEGDSILAGEVLRRLPAACSMQLVQLGLLLPN